MQPTGAVGSSTLGAAERKSLVEEVITGRGYYSSSQAQITAVARMRLLSAMHDWRTLLFILVPLIVCIVTIQYSDDFGNTAEVRG